ncbi:MAG: transcriptional repressor NrdR [Proteobacteria bacterium]|nr:transcriptional repressor NrdR [Pseudomonadota bacterium]
MRCPFCSHENTAVKDSRTTDDQTSIRRRRVCETCGSRFTTFEHVHLKDVQVIKKDGQVQPYDRHKIRQSIQKAVHKRQVSSDQIEKMVTAISRQIEQFSDTEIKSQNIGQLIMQSLLEIDPVSYIRFASVYQDFKDVNDFVQMITSLKVLNTDKYE